METFLLTLIAGALGGNLLHVVHRITRRLDLTLYGNSLAGLLGGGLGGAVANAIGGAGAESPVPLVALLLAGMLGGAASVAVIAGARNLMAR